MKRIVGILLALMMVLVVSALPADARGRHGGGHLSFGVTVGPSWWGPGWGWGGPYYPYYPYQPYQPYQPPVIIQEPREIYVEPAPQVEEPVYWYYCPDPAGYYPYVERCPKGWMKVVPPAEAPEGGE